MALHPLEIEGGRLGRQIGDDMRSLVLSPLLDVYEDVGYYNRSALRTWLQEESKSIREMSEAKQDNGSYLDYIRYGIVKNEAEEAMGGAYNKQGELSSPVRRIVRAWCAMGVEEPVERMRIKLLSLKGAVEGLAGLVDL